MILWSWRIIVRYFRGRRGRDRMVVGFTTSFGSVSSSCSICDTRCITIMDKEKAGLWIRQAVHIRGYLWHKMEYLMSQRKSLSCGSGPFGFWSKQQQKTGKKCKRAILLLFMHSFWFNQVFRFIKKSSFSYKVLCGCGHLEFPTT